MCPFIPGRPLHRMAIPPSRIEFRVFFFCLFLLFPIPALFGAANVHAFMDPVGDDVRLSNAHAPSCCKAITKKSSTWRDYYAMLPKDRSLLTLLALYSPVVILPRIIGTC